MLKSFSNLLLHIFLTDSFCYHSNLIKNADVTFTFVWTFPFLFFMLFFSSYILFLLSLPKHLTFDKGQRSKVKGHSTMSQPVAMPIIMFCFFSMTTFFILFSFFNIFFVEKFFNDQCDHKSRTCGQLYKFIVFNNSNSLNELW